MIEGTSPLVPTQVLKKDVLKETATCVSTPPTGAITPPTSPITETSTPATIETTTSVHKQPEKIEDAKASVRRQLLKDDMHEGMTTAAKKSKQQE